MESALSICLQGPSTLPFAIAYSPEDSNQSQRRITSPWGKSMFYRP